MLVLLQERSFLNNIVYLNVSAPLGSMLINRFDYRVCSMVGGFIAAAGISLGFFANHIMFLFVTHGILTGKVYVYK